MPARFVLLRHTLPANTDRRSHWDLLLERSDTCWTWALYELPTGLGGTTDTANVLGTRLADHRKHYLHHEGPVAGNRGIVKRALEGQCEWLEELDDLVCVRLTFSTTTVVLRLEQRDQDQWSLTVH